MVSSGSNNIFSIFECVTTVYGCGYIAEVRANDYLVKLGNWQLAQGQSPSCYLSADSIKKIPGAFPGSMVKTVYGPSRILAIDGNAKHVVQPINWTLANKSKVTMYLQPEAVELTMTPGFNEGDAVMTTYGVGFVDQVREIDIVVKLDNWALAQGQSPTLYLDPKTVVKIPGFKVGQCCKTVWGLVRIIDILRDGQHVCEALHWTLADGTKVKFHLNPDALALKSLPPDMEL